LSPKFGILINPFISIFQKNWVVTGCVDLSLPEDGDHDFSEPDSDEDPAPSSTQMTATNVFTGDPLSHYVSDCG
jgi:hypothetical protein